MTDVSMLTVGLSAGVSVVTGYIGTLMNYSRQRARQRRTYGLSLLAEIKALHGLSRQYYGTFGSGAVDFETYRLPRLRFTNADMSVFTNVSGNVGLFSTRAAVGIINYYSIVRNLVAQAQALLDMQNEMQDQPAVEAAFRQELADHVALLRVAHHHTEFVVRILRRETPMTADEKIRIARRRAILAARRLRRRMFGSRIVLHRRNTSQEGGPVEASQIKLAALTNLSGGTSDA